MFDRLAKSRDKPGLLRLATKGHEVCQPIDELKDPLVLAPQDRRRTATLVYSGFAKCAYPYQKFQSDIERVLAVTLERDARRWLRPVAGQFNIYYRRGIDQPEYIPDFVAATEDVNLLIETKKSADMQADEVLVMARAAAAWCAHATTYATGNGAKGWLPPLTGFGVWS